jgi:HK97 gp10 family phage protein
MAVKGIINFSGIDEYLRQLQQLEIDIDQAAIAAVETAAPMVKAEMTRLAKEHKLSGATMDSVYLTGVQSIGSFHFVELGARVDGESAALFNEFGTVYMEARPFVRPALNNVRTRWRNSVKATLKARIGVDFG